MSGELYDCRGKVTAFGHCALAAESRARDVDKSELIREIVEEWARKKYHAATLLQACMTAKGVTAADAGIVGRPGETLEWDAT